MGKKDIEKIELHYGDIQNPARITFWFWQNYWTHKSGQATGTESSEGLQHLMMHFYQACCMVITAHFTFALSIKYGVWLLCCRSKTAMALPYMRTTELFLMSIGTWPSEYLGHRLPRILFFHRYFYPFESMSFILGNLHYLLTKNDLSFLDSGHQILNMFLGSMCFTRSTVPYFAGFGKITRKFVLEFHLINHRKKGRHFEEVYWQINKLSSYFTIYQVCMMLGAMCLYNFEPIYFNYNAGAYSLHRPKDTKVEFSLYFSFPGFNPEDHFFIISVLNYWLSWICTISVCVIDLYLGLMVFQILGHIQILMRTLDNLTLPKNSYRVDFSIIADKLLERPNTASSQLESYDAEENKDLKHKLKSLCQHHWLVVEFAQNMSQFFGPMLAYNYMFNLCSGCVLLLFCSGGEAGALARYGPLTIIIFGELIQISVIFEIVGYMSEKLFNQLYYTPWQMMDISNQRTVRIMLMRWQSPIEVTAMGMVPVGVKTMISVFKTTLSYFAFLRTMA